MEMYGDKIKNINKYNFKEGEKVYFVYLIFDLKDVRKKVENGDKFACYILGRSYDSEENGESKTNTY